MYYILIKDLHSQELLENDGPHESHQILLFSLPSAPANIEASLFSREGTPLWSLITKELKQGKRLTAHRMS